ncbi:hypothetical protein GOODEAATRI_007564, partial [Goodea atripinnis]
EGTSKFATLEINPKRAQRRHQQQRDLGGLINFEKRRKVNSLFLEFEVIAQIKLLQLASNNYSFTQESHFREWFAALNFPFCVFIETYSSVSCFCSASSRQLTEAGCSGGAGSHSKSFDHSHYRPYQGGGGDSGDALSVTSVSSSGSDLEDVNTSFLSDSPEGHERKVNTRKSGMSRSGPL